MALVNYDPLSFLGRAHAQWNPFLNAADESARERRWTPAVDVSEEDDRFVLLADVPGVDPKAIEVTMDGDQLTIRGERASTSAPQAGRYQRLERANGSFVRRFALPDSADAQNIKARCDKGVLEVTIAKKKDTAPRRIAVN